MERSARARARESGAEGLANFASNRSANTGTYRLSSYNSGGWTAAMQEARASARARSTPLAGAARRLTSALNLTQTSLLFFSNPTTRIHTNGSALVAVVVVVVVAVPFPFPFGRLPSPSPSSSSPLRDSLNVCALLGCIPGPARCCCWHEGARACSGGGGPCCSRPGDVAPPQCETEGGGGKGWGLYPLSWPVRGERGARGEMLRTWPALPLLLLGKVEGC